MSSDTQSGRKIIIEQHKRFSQSSLWRMQREYFEKEGINAWVNQVPFYITSNPFIAECYAQVVLACILDWIEKHPESKKHPFYILELGTGSGRFSFFVIKTLTELMQSLKLNDISICYVMSDFTKNNIKYYEKHDALLPYLEKGLIDFAIYDMESERAINLQRKNIKLGPDTLVNPLIVFANYIFDTVSQDAFTVHDGKLYELLFSLSTDENNLAAGHPADMEKVSIENHIREISTPYYNDEKLDSILDQYKKHLKDSSFLFPVGSMRAIQYLQKITNNKLMVISSDKGYGTLESLDHLSHPSLSFHGSFSLMVNFHAIANFFKNCGGDYFLQTPRKGIKTSVFVSGLTFDNMPRTSTAIEKYVEGFSPADYFTVHRRISDSFQECNLDTIAAHMHLAKWDPHIYLKLTARVAALVDEGDKETIEFMSANMPKMAANYYFMPKSECILFEIGVFFHATKNYEQALKYYQLAQPYVGEQFGIYYNMALCEHHLLKHADALEHFKQALKLDPESKETEEWVGHMEKLISGEKDTEQK